jgi:hypothetical protein
MMLVKILGYTMLNIRYAALILPCGIVAYLLQLYPLAVMAGILLVAAFAAEVALSISNGIEAYRAIEAQKQWEKYQDEQLAMGLQNLERFSNGEEVGLDGTEGEHAGTEGEAGRPGWEGEDPAGEGQAGRRR